MKINTLQSLIDRTSNQIAEYEAAIRWEYEHRHFCEADFELEQSEYTVKYYKARLPKLREVQKELKREIKKEIKKSELQRFYDSM